MLTATEFYAVTPGLHVILWVEAIIYLGIGTFELFDDFLAKPRPWMYAQGRPNSYLMLQHKVGHKMHAGLCFILGMIALNGALEGVVTRFELELVFLSFAVILPVLWSTLLPGRLGVVVLMLKPEFWLQGLMLLFFSDLIRPQIVAVCIALNLWGVLVYAMHTPSADHALQVRDLASGHHQRRGRRHRAEIRQTCRLQSSRSINSPFG